MGDWLDEKLYPKDDNCTRTAVWWLALSNLAQWVVLILLILRVYGRI